MMENLSKALADVALAGIGLTAIAIEKSGELIQKCAEKGADTLEKGRAAGQEWKVKAEEAAKEGRERCKQDYLARLTPEERADLRAKLNELDAREAEAAKEAEEAAKVIDFEPEHKDDQE